MNQTMKTPGRCKIRENKSLVPSRLPLLFSFCFFLFSKRILHFLQPPLIVPSFSPTPPTISKAAVLKFNSIQFSPSHLEPLGGGAGGGVRDVFPEA